MQCRGVKFGCVIHGINSMIGICGIKIFPISRTYPIVFVLGIIWTGLFYLINDLKKKSRISREKEFHKYIKRTGDIFLDHFDDPIRDGMAMYCFQSMEAPYYFNVIEKSYDEDRTKLYIGELEWTQQIELSISKRSESTFATRVVDETDGQHKGFRNYATMCVLYDNGFRLPNFDLTNETFAKKTAEVLRLNKTQKIPLFQVHVKKLSSDFSIEKN